MFAVIAISIPTARPLKWGGPQRGAARRSAAQHAELYGSAVPSATAPAVVAPAGVTIGVATWAATAAVD